MSNVKMLKLTIAALAASMALPALAGGWPDIPARKAVAPKAAVTEIAPGGFVYGGDEAGYSIEQYRYFTTEEDKVYGPRRWAAAPARQAVATRSSDGFEFVAGETGSQLTPHKLVLANGRFAHSNECDHAIRSVKGPTPAEVDATRSLSPGA